MKAQEIPFLLVFDLFLYSDVFILKSDISLKNENISFWQLVSLCDHQLIHFCVILNHWYISFGMIDLLTCVCCMEDNMSVWRSMAYSMSLYVWRDKIFFCTFFWTAQKRSKLGKIHVKIKIDGDVRVGSPINQTKPPPKFNSILLSYSHLPGCQHRCRAKREIRGVEREFAVIEHDILKIYTS